MIRSHLTAFLEDLNASYWFIPAVMASLGFVLALLAILIDEQVDARVPHSLSLFFVSSPEAARVLLSTIASSMITVAGTVFSLTLVVLSLTSQQHGPLTLGNFMRNRGNQFVLGTFTATFVYCIVVLQTVENTDDGIFVPYIASLIAVILAMLSVAVLIYFIHHVSESIQAFRIVQRITHDLLHAIDALFPSDIGQGNTPKPELVASLQENTSPIPAPRSGYVQVVDEDKLLAIAKEHDLVLLLRDHPGRFLIKDSVLVDAWPRERVTKDVVKAVHEAYNLGGRRTQSQDMMLMVDQLGSMAVRALSPGVNDPYTAVMCIDRLAEAVAHLGKAEEPSRYRYDDNHHLRVVAHVITFEEMLRSCFDEIRVYGCADPKVAAHLMAAIGDILERVPVPDHRALLWAYAQLLWKQCGEHITEPWDRQGIEQAYRSVFNQMQPWAPPIPDDAAGRAGKQE
ncbi:MAG: DUF2254 domain-containing protein [Anaerolineae bacterium]